jgi:hypothetical protein
MKNNRFKEDESEKSFLFTQRNPHGMLGRRFLLKRERKSRGKSVLEGVNGIHVFGDGSHIGISSECQTKRNRDMDLGTTYGND